MNIDALLADARRIWGDRMTLNHIAVAMGVVHGDICRQARIQKEGGAVNDAELQKELGNIIFSAIRWCDDLGYSPEKCITLAKQAQASYTKKHIKP